MPESSMIGSRIRERRVMNGIRQSDLARRVGISPSYLNLIEHNRRRIGGKTLLDIADALEVEPALLSEGAEATLITGLREAAGAQAAQGVETDRTEEFAGRFPGWARLLVDLHGRAGALQRTVETLTDRLAHDPHLADSLHEVISTVTAIRSTSSILVETEALEPEWQNRFHRNIDEDSRRLAEGAEALVRYLEGRPIPRSRSSRRRTSCWRSCRPTISISRRSKSARGRRLRRRSWSRPGRWFRMRRGGWRWTRWSNTARMPNACR